MDRKNFLKTVFRVLLLGILGLIAYATGSRNISAASCEQCPENGNCSLNGNCDKLITFRNGKR